MNDTVPLLFEIGCEEIPARFLAQSQIALGKILQALLEEYRLLPELPEGVQTFSTPRRLVAYAPALLVHQPDKIEQVQGPPVKVAFDAEGKPTRAATSFLEKNSARLQDLTRISTPKGEYLALKRTLKGEPAARLLPELLMKAIASLSFPKSMYWEAKAGPRFVRPIRWILALLGEGENARTVRFEYAGVKSGNFTFGHRLSGFGKIRVTGFHDYKSKLFDARVEIDPGVRRQTILEKSKGILDDSVRLVQDKGLEEWIVNSTEWPSALRGSFDPRFLHLPREILITVMRDHQKYFAVENLQGKLEASFVAVLNVGSDSRGLIRQGHERVLEARFTDAEFFWKSDLREPLAARGEKLERVTYEAELGSYADKVRRMKVLTNEIANQLKLAESERRDALRAVELSKCDLTTQMVQEFPELQGIVGGLYARAQGEPDEVADAVYDHYLPQSMEDRCPRSLVGAVVSLADKIDAVVAGFAIGREPSGSSDPFALRRQGNGVIKVILELLIPVALTPIVDKALELLDASHRRPQLGPEMVAGFFRERMGYYLENIRGLRYDTVRAVLAACYDSPVEALRCAEALESIRGGEDFEALCNSAKRIRNILTKSASPEDRRTGRIDPDLLEPGPERDLFETWRRVSQEAAARRQTRDYVGALRTIAALRPQVDLFFDRVLVMSEDEKQRRNRIQLLVLLDELFSGVADFAEIVPAPAHVDAST